MKRIFFLLSIFTCFIENSCIAQIDTPNFAKKAALCTLGVICVGVPLYRMGNKCSHAAQIMRNDDSDSKPQSMLSDASNVLSQVCTISGVCLKMMGTAVIGTAVYVVTTSLEGNACDDADAKDGKKR